MDELLKLKAVVRFLRNELSSDLQLQTLHTLLAIATSSEPKDNKSLEKELGQVSQAAISRNVRNLGTIMVKQKDGSHQKAGYGLIDTRPDLYETRRLASELNDDGKKLIAKLRKILKK
ncbi:hypothetical protein ACFL6N_04215 [Thermodesulfobacteriota bacterium]